MFVQRSIPSSESLEKRGLWQPEFGAEYPSDLAYLRVTDEGRRHLAVGPGDSYVVVDERIGTTVRLAIDTWPEVDEGGRLRFEGETATLVVEERGLLEKVQEGRRGHGQPAPDRPIRIGDAFLVRGSAAAGLGGWEEVIDVTLMAREAAKTAMYGAVAPVLAEGESLEPEEAAEEPPPSGPAARPAV